MHILWECTIHVALLCGMIRCKVLDMSYNYANSGMSYHPTIKDKFKLTIMQAGVYGKIPWAAYNKFSMFEHLGTHIDAPYHFLKTGQQIHEIQLKQLHGPAVVIDIRERAKQNVNAPVLKKDLQTWEEKYGRIPDKAFILMYSGWGQYWTDGPYGRYIGFRNGTTGGTTMNMPGFSEEAIDWLLENRGSFLGLGSDSMSFDIGNNTKWSVHVKLLGAGKVGIENMAKMDKIPHQGAHLYLFPMKIQGGTGAATRAYAAWGSDTGPFSVGVGIGNAPRLSPLSSTIFIIFFISCILF